RIGGAAAVEPLLRFVLMGYTAGSAVHESSAGGTGGGENAQHGGGVGVDGPLLEAALASLGRLGDRPAVGPLLSALQAPSVVARPGAARALGELGDGRAIAPLARALDAREPGLREAAARALGRLRAASATSVLKELLADPERRVRAAAAWSLGEIGGPEARE